MTGIQSSLAPLPPAQVEVAAALAMGGSIVSIARRTGVHRSTIHNWLKDAAFSAALADLRQQHAAQLDGQLKQIANQAIDTIRQILADSKVAASVRLRAALAVLDRPMFPRPGLTREPEVESDQPQADQPLDIAAPPPLRQNEPKPSKTVEICREVARNAPCPCGSGVKYKRCCGVHAPPLLHHTAA